MHNILSSYGADGYLVLNHSDIRYFSKLTSSNIALLITKEESFVFSDARYKYRIESQNLFNPIVCRGSLLSSVKTKINELKLEKILLDPDDISYSAYLDNFADISNKLILKKEITKEIRAIKKEDEIKSLIKAQNIAEESLKEIFPLIKKGVTTAEIAAKLDMCMAVKGSEEPAFSTIVLTGAKTADCHGVPDNTEIEENNFVLFDFGATADGIRSDMTRTVVCGEATPFMEEMYNIVLTAHEKAAAELKEGIYAKDADALAREYIKEKGYGDLFLHALGHGVGLDIHEYPTLSEKSETMLLKNMTVTVEPGIYIRDKFGIRIEDTYIIGENKADSIAKMEKSLIKLK